MRDRRTEASVLELFRALAEGERPLVAPGFPLGTSGVAADLAILADEFIGVLIARPGSDPAVLGESLRVHRRYFEHVALVLTRGPAPDDAHGAAVWRIGGGRGFAEERSGVGGVVGASAWFDLMTVDERRVLLGGSLPEAHIHARAASPVPPERVRAHCVAGITARLGPASDAFWTRVEGRAIRSDDVSRLHPPVGIRLAA